VSEQKIQCRSGVKKNGKGGEGVYAYGGGNRNGGRNPEGQIALGQIGEPETAAGIGNGILKKSYAKSRTNGEVGSKC